MFMEWRITTFDPERETMKMDGVDIVMLALVIGGTIIFSLLIATAYKEQVLKQDLLIECVKHHEPKDCNILIK